EDRAGREPVAVRAVDAGLQLRPDAVVGPDGRILVRTALEVHPLDRVAALRDEREAAVGAGVDELRGAGGRLAEDPEPGEGVLMGEAPAAGLRHRAAADAARAVGAHEPVADDAARRTVRACEVDVRALRVEAGRA